MTCRPTGKNTTARGGGFFFALEGAPSPACLGFHRTVYLTALPFPVLFSPAIAVVSSGNTIGEIPYSAQIKEDENVFLAARVWKITSVDSVAHKIEVIAANDGKNPNFPAAPPPVTCEFGKRCLKFYLEMTGLRCLTRRG